MKLIISNKCSERFLDWVVIIILLMTLIGSQWALYTVYSKWG
ncbi:hypothetical protein LCGC14_0957470 [marine sediment metagenome]|uniref:Uncharacterized protein n=1 Tax=marine sediment metagenome TaxID=412755 RepID=A0A0F9RLW6_9ZZZZ